MVQQGFTPETTAAIATQTLTANLDAITSEIDGVLLNEDIEFIHRFRVAIRRLRNNVTIFQSFGSHALESALAEFHQQTDSLAILLAEARDLDIQQVLITEHLADNHPVAAVALTGLVSEKRQQIQHEITADLQVTAFDSQIENFKTLLKSMFPRESRMPSLPADMPVRANARACAQTIAGLYLMRDNIDALERHQFRKVVRRLRYTLECFQPYFSFDLQPSIDYVHLIQDLLGNIHDLDILLQIVADNRTNLHLLDQDIFVPLHNAQSPYLEQFKQVCESGSFMQELQDLLKQFNQMIYPNNGKNNYDRSTHW